jgi:hypothetical protein
MGRGSLGLSVLTWSEGAGEERRAAARGAGRGERRRRPTRRTRLSRPFSIAPAGRRRLGGEGEAARDGAGRNGTARPAAFGCFFFPILFALSFPLLMDELRG